MFRKLRSLFYGSRFGDDIDREISTHLAMEIEHRRRRGMSDDEARRTALRDFGGVEKTREEVRDARGMTFWEVLRQDTRFGVRSLRRSPGYTLAAITILALGIGANTAMFSVIRGVLLKPLPFRGEDRIALLEQRTSRTDAATTAVSINELYDYRSRLRSVEDLVEYHRMSFTLLNQGDPDRVDTGVVSANFFSALGVQPLIGRGFVDADARLGAQQVVLLTYEYWQSKFGADPKVVNKAVEMNNAQHLIIGVLPPFPQYPEANDIYMPTSACPFRAGSEAAMAQSHRSFANLSVFGWLKPGVTVEQASTEIDGVAQSFQSEFPKDYPITGFTGAVTPLRTELVRGAEPMLMALTAATILVLIIACANVANLALARTVRRNRELAVRTALGAGRRRLVRQLVTESLILSTVGGAIGVLLARAALGGLVDFVARFTERTGQISIDGTVLAYGLAVSVLTGVICGVVPALTGDRHLMSSMRDGAAQGGESAGRQRFRSMLVVAQVAVSFVLLIGAGLLLQSVYRMSAVPLGFDTEKVMSAAIFGNFSRNQSADDRARFVQQTLERLRVSPGVSAAALTNAVPMTVTNPGTRTFQIGGRAVDEASPLQATAAVISDGYFETLGVPLLRGRAFNAGDLPQTTAVAIINESMAKAWGTSEPIGSTLIVGPPSFQPTAPPTELTVVGVVSDFRLFGPSVEMQAQYYLPLVQVGSIGGRVLVRASGDPSALAGTIRDAIHSVDPQIPVEQVQTLYELKRSQLQRPTLTAGLLSAFAAVALVITLAGISGLIGTSVGQRTREFGVRMALGAGPWRIVGSVVGRGVRLVAAGIAVGVAGAYVFSQTIVKFLFHTTPTDVSAYVAIAVILLGVGALAAFIPARRITGIDPLKALRID